MSKKKEKMVEINEINNHNCEDDDDDDDDAEVKATVQLGFSEPILLPKQENNDENNYFFIGHRSPYWWNDWDGGQIGGKPSWLQPQNIPTKPMYCLNCYHGNSNSDNGGSVSENNAISSTKKQHLQQQQQQQQQKPMQFIGQLYVPLDNIATAFHRSFYIWGCSNCCNKLGEKNSKNNNNKDDDDGSTNNTNIKLATSAIRVLRVQLPKDNIYYPTEQSSQSHSRQKQDWTKHLPQTYNIQLCDVCGQRAKGKCPLQDKWFCCKIHQKEYYQYIYRNSSNNNYNNNNKSDTNNNNNSNKEKLKQKEQQQQQQLQQVEEMELIIEEQIDNDNKKNTAVTTIETLNNAASYLPSVYAESELVVEEEPPSPDYDNEIDEDDDENEIEARPTMFATLKKKSNSYNINNDNDSDEDLEQEDLNEMITGERKQLDQTSIMKDPITASFYHRIQSRKVPEQCLRYTMEWRKRYDIVDCVSKTPPSTEPSSSSSSQQQQQQQHQQEEQQQDDSQPLWIRSDHQPSTIPPCPYCQAPRAFEFQLMPQMLNFLHANSPSTKNKNNVDTQDNKNHKNQTAKQALIAAQSIIHNTDKSLIPPSFVDTKAKAMKILQDELYQDDIHRVDWGVVAIYSCTKSCGGGDYNDDDGGGDDNTDNHSNEREANAMKQYLGAYREEFAWVQPSLDL